MSEVSGNIPAIKADAAGDGDHPPTLAATGAPVGDARLAEPAQFRMVLVSFLAAAIGLIAGCVAFLLYKLIGLFTNIVFYHRFVAEFTSARHHQLGAWVILMPVIGGVIVGVMAKYATSKIKGHGIPEAMEAVLINRSRIAPRVAILKPISAAIAIGTGGPFGAEGPIIQTGGAIGSLVGQAFHATTVERKVLLACGAAAGMSATFNTPIAGVILAIELLLFEFKSRSFIPLVDREHAGDRGSHAVPRRWADVHRHLYGFRNSESTAVLSDSGRDLRPCGGRVQPVAVLD